MRNFQTATNKGRAAKMLAIIEHLDVSADSNKAGPGDWEELIGPVLSALQSRVAKPAPLLASCKEEGSASPPEAPAPTPPVSKEMDRLETLSTTQLIDRMIACGRILAERRT